MILLARLGLELAIDINLSIKQVDTFIYKVQSLSHGIRLEISYGNSDHSVLESIWLNAQPSDFTEFSIRIAVWGAQATIPVATNI